MGYNRGFRALNRREYKVNSFHFTVKTAKKTPVLAFLESKKVTLYPVLKAGRAPNLETIPFASEA